MPLQHDGGMVTREAVHRHRWQLVSSHQVSDGLVIYQRCACGRWRVARTPVDPIADIAEIGA